MSEPNPIAQRIDLLRKQWTAFAEDPAAVLLHWVIEPGEEKLLEAFFEFEGTEHGTLPDLFLPLETEFEDSRTFGRTLVVDLCSNYEEMRATLTEAGLNAEWFPPPAASSAPDDIAALKVTLASFHAHHQPLFRRVVLVLRPKIVHDHRGFASWVDRAVGSWTIDQARLVVPDYREALLLRGLLERHPAKVHGVLAELDLRGALEEVAAQGRLDTPEGQFRLGYVQMANAAGRGDMATAASLAERLYPYLSQPGWEHMGVALEFVLGAGFMGKKDYTSAVQRYAAAEEHAKRIARNPRMSLGLQVNSRFAIGSVFVAAGAWGRGATIYEETAPVADQLGEPRWLLECWRMASFCYERDRAWAKAWETGTRALAVGREMDDQTRKTSTLAFVGEGLLRITEHGGYGAYGRGIDQEMRTLLGDDWRLYTTPGAAPPLEVTPAAEGEAAI